MEPFHVNAAQADEFAIGSLPAELDAAVRLHIDGCAECAELVADACSVASALLLSVPRRVAPPGLKRRVFQSAGISRPSVVVRVVKWGTAGAGIAAAVVAVLALTGMLSVRGDIQALKSENASLASRLDDALAQKVQIAALGREVDEQARRAADLLIQAQGDRELVLAVLSPESQMAEVYSVDDGLTGAAIGRFIWDDEQKKVWFVASRLRSLDHGQTYQLWVNAGGRYQTLGTFNSDDLGFARYTTVVPQGLKGYDSVVITVEAAPGAEERSGPSVFVADLSELRR
jgi:Anti-sigma-K factor rskA